MANLADMIGEIYQSAMVYGPPKGGKTQLAGELAMHDEIEGIIWIDIENGVETLMKLPMHAKKKITVIQLPDTRSNPVAANTCLKLVRGTKVAICEEHGVADCPSCKKAGLPMPTYELSKLPSNWVVVFDSITQLTESFISYITQGKPDTYKMQTDDWGDLSKLIAVFLSHIQQAKFNVVCISHEIEAQREDGTDRIVPVAGSRNSSRNSAKAFGHVVYVEVKAKKHVINSTTTGNANVIAGSRSDIDLGAVKDGTASLFPIFAAAAKAAKTKGNDQSNKLGAVSGEGSQKQSDGTVQEEAKQVEQSQEQPEQAKASEEQVVVADGNANESSPVDHAAVLAAMPSLMERIKYKKQHGIK